MIGIGDQDIISLRDLCRQPDIDADRIQTILERLLRIMDNIWGFTSPHPASRCCPATTPMLPPQLLLRVGQARADAAVTAITPTQLPAQDLPPGTAVSLAGFAVQKVDPARRTITLRLPMASPAQRPLACGCASPTASPCRSMRPSRSSSWHMAR